MKLFILFYKFRWRSRRGKWFSQIPRYPIRIEFVKPLNDWEDIYGGRLIKRYTKCPPSLENWKCNDDFNDIQKYIYSMEDTEEQYDLVMLCFRVRRVQRWSTHKMTGPTTRIVLIWAHGNTHNRCTLGGLKESFQKLNSRYKTSRSL